MADRKKRVQRKVVIALITSALLHFTAARVQAEDSAPENQSKEAATAAIPESTLKLKLIGTYLADPIEQSVAIIRIDGNPEVLFEIGDEIIKKVLLTEVRPEEIIIDNNGRLELIKLEEPPVTKVTQVTTNDARLAATKIAAVQSEQHTTEKIQPAIENSTKPGDLLADNYIIQTHDRIGIAVADEPDLTMAAVVSKTGHIDYSYLGRMAVEGITKTQLQDEITDILGSGYLKNPSVEISIDVYRSFRITGEVNKPGNYSLKQAQSLTNAIHQAGGTTNRASLRKIFLTRAIEGERKRFRVDMGQSINPGDIIDVGEAFF